MAFGLYRILHRIGGSGFVDRLALLTLLAVLPQAGLWLAFRIAYPFFGTRFLLLLLVPLYLSAIVAALLPARFSESTSSSVPWTEILASSAAAGLLILAIALSSLSSRVLDSRIGRAESIVPDSRPLAGTANGMLT
jgi:hypothetical protein